MQTAHKVTTSNFPISRNESEVLDYYLECQTKRKYTPTIREVGAALHMSHTTVKRILDQLERHGRIQKKHNKARSVTILMTEYRCNICHKKVYTHELPEICPNCHTFTKWSRI